MKTSRQQVLEFIESHRYVTVEEISRAMRMTKANARHHVSILIDQGLLEVYGLQPVQGKGRPARIITTTPRSNINHLEMFLNVALNRFPVKKHKKEPHPFQAIAMDLIDEYCEKFDIQDIFDDSESSLANRLYSAVQILNKMNYSARWEAHLHSPHLILGNCPYKSIVKNHPELCNMDTYIIRRLTDRNAHHISKLEMDERGIPYCLFNIFT